MTQNLHEVTGKFEVKAMTVKASWLGALFLVSVWCGPVSTYASLADFSTEYIAYCNPTEAHRMVLSQSLNIAFLCEESRSAVALKKINGIEVKINGPKGETGLDPEFEIVKISTASKSCDEIKDLEFGLKNLRSKSETPQLWIKLSRSFPKIEIYNSRRGLWCIDSDTN